MKKESFIITILVVLGITIMTAGFGWILGKDIQIWPFNRGWFMFCSSAPYVYKISAKATLANQEVIEIDLDRWFHFPASPLTKRYDEMGRHKHFLKSLAQYICQKDRRLESISLYDYWWHTQPGTRPDLSHKFENQKQLLLKNEKCERGQR